MLPIMYKLIYDAHTNMQQADITNRKSGLLTAIEPLFVDKHGNVVWKCLCACGKTSEVNVNNFSREHIKSCGCTRVDSYRKYRASLVPDYLNKTFGLLTVLERIEDKNLGGVHYRCRCRCGNEGVYYWWDLKVGRRTTCGCVSPVLKYEATERCFNSLFLQYQWGAVKRGFSFELTKDEFMTLVGKNCFYCEKEPLQIHRIMDRNKACIKYNGIDRVNNKEGYTPNNCVPCCKTCNIAKRNMSFDDFKNWIVKVYNNLI